MKLASGVREVPVDDIRETLEKVNDWCWETDRLVNRLERRLERLKGKRHRNYYLEKKIDKELRKTKEVQKILWTSELCLSKSNPVGLNRMCCSICDFPIDPYIMTDTSAEAVRYCPMCGQRVTRDLTRMSSLYDFTMD